MAQWYYAQDEEQFGPISAAALKEMAQAGELGREDLIWREGMERWAPAHKVRGLFVEELDGKSAKAKSNGKADDEPHADDDPSDPVSDVLPVDDDPDDSTGDKETAIDVLPLEGPEESKMHMPALGRPNQSPPARSESDELVVFEPASATPPPPVLKQRPSESKGPPPHESSTSRQNRIDAPEAPKVNLLVGIGLFLQTFTWVTCLLVVIVGGVVYLGVLTTESDGLKRLSASGVYATFVLASYFLARGTERMCRTLGAWFDIKTERTSRRSVRERNRQRFQ